MRDLAVLFLHVVRRQNQRGAVVGQKGDVRRVDRPMIMMPGGVGVPTERAFGRTSAEL